MIIYNGIEYLDDQPVDWDVAIDVGGFYFSRAKYLGLSQPPACFVFKDFCVPDDNTQLSIIGRYHQLFNDAEADDCERVADFYGMPF